MADTTALKNRIRAAIKANDNQEITGPVLQQSLLDIVDELDLNPELENEISARQNGDSTLQQGINTERQARIDADNTLQQGINTERQQRQDADNRLLQNNFIFGFDYSKGNISYDSNQHYHQIIDLIETEIISGEFVQNDLNLAYVNFNSYMAGYFYIQLRYAKPEDEGTTTQSGFLISQVAKSSLKKGEIISLLFTGDSKSVRVTVRISNDFPEGSSFENKEVKVPLCVYRNGYNTYQGITNLRSDIAKNDRASSFWGDYITTGSSLTVPLPSGASKVYLYINSAVSTSPVNCYFFNSNNEYVRAGFFTSPGIVEYSVPTGYTDRFRLSIDGNSEGDKTRVTVSVDTPPYIYTVIKNLNTHNANILLLQNRNIDLRCIPLGDIDKINAYINGIKAISDLVSNVEVFCDGWPAQYFFQMAFIWYNTYSAVPGLGIQYRIATQPTFTIQESIIGDIQFTTGYLYAGRVLEGKRNVTIGGNQYTITVRLTIAKTLTSGGEYPKIACGLPIMVNGGINDGLEGKANNAALVALENANVDIRNIKNPFDIRQLLEQYVSLNRIVSKVEIVSEDFPEDYYFQLSYIWLNTYSPGLGIQVRFSDDPNNFPATGTRAFTILTDTAIKAGDIIKYNFNIPLIAGATRHFQMVLTMADNFAADAEFNTLHCSIPILIKRSGEYSEIAEVKDDVKKINIALYGDPFEQTEVISFDSEHNTHYEFRDLVVGKDYKLTFTADSSLNLNLLAITDSGTSIKNPLYWGAITPNSVHYINYHCEHAGAFLVVWTNGENVLSSGSLTCVLNRIDEPSFDTRIKALEGSNTLSAFILPEAIYTVCNDLNKQRQYAVRLYLDHLFNELPDRPNIRNIGTTFGVFYSKYTSYAKAINTPEHNRTVDVDTRNNTLVLKADGYQDLTLQIPHISVRNSITKNSKVRLLCIGDSVTAGYLANFNKVNANDPNVYWGYVKMLFEMDKLGDGGASSSNYFFESLGNIVSNTFNIAHDGLSENGVKAYACGVGGTRTTDWLSPTVGGNTNPFYDTYNQRFSLQYWVTKYRTLLVNNDGTTTRCDDSNKGELAGDVNAANVCEPTHVLIQLGYNQSYSTEDSTRNTYLSELITMIERIHTEYPTVKILLSLPDTPGTFWPSEWPEFFGDGWDVYSLDFTRGTAKTSHMNFAFMNKDLKALAAEYDYVYYAPTYFATPNCDGAAVRNQKEFCYHASQLKYRQKYFVHDEAAPNLHPNNCAHASWAYQIYSLIKYTLTL